MKISKILTISVVALTLNACGTSKTGNSVEEPATGVSLDGDKPIIMRRGLNGLDPESNDPIARQADLPIVGSAPIAMPKALLYKTSGNYNDKVPVQVSADSGQLISFPAPTDIPANPEPIRLVYGWLLSPVGVSANSVFTRWTYAEYRALAAPPSPDEILAAIIPGAKVTMTMQAPMTQSEALADTTAVNEFIMANQVTIAPTR